jgi:hypothetical protein
VVDKVALGQRFSEYFGFPCQFSFHRPLHNHHLSSGAGTISQIISDVPNGLSLISTPETEKKTWTEATHTVGLSLLSIQFNLFHPWIIIHDMGHVWTLLRGWGYITQRTGWVL